MNWRRELSKLLGLLGRQKATDDVEEEIRCHLKLEELEQVQCGLSPEEAHYAAMRQFGNVTSACERSSDMWRWNAAEALVQDVRFGARQLRRNPGFAAVATLTLALGIGATTVIFSVANSVLLRPLPFKDPGRLVQLFETEEAPGNFPLSGADYLDWQAQNHSLEGTSLYSWPRSMNASGASEPESATVVNAQSNIFDVLGVRPFKGRGFSLGEDAAGKNRVAVLSYGFWERHLGGNPEAIGMSVVLNDEPYTIVGVLPPWFSFLGGVDVWTPVDMNPKELGPRGNHGWSAIGRLKGEVNVAQARSELLAISKRLEKQYPNSNDRVHAVLLPLKDMLIGNSQAPLLVLLGAVMLVLLVACVNVANVQLARASARHREMALRASLGAGRWRLVRQLLTESMLLALTGAVLGTLSAWWCIRLLDAAQTIPIPRANPVELDGAVLLFTVAVTVLAGVSFGLAPALQGSEFSLGEELKAGAQPVVSVAKIRKRLRDALVVAEIATTLALLVGAGLLLRSFAHLRGADIGVNPHNVVTMSINLPLAKYSTLAKRRQFFDQLVDSACNMPGIESAAVSAEIPMQGGSNGYIHVEGEKDPKLDSQLVGWNYITPEYFRTLRIPLVAGRNFGREDLDRTAGVTQKIFDLYKAAPELEKMKIPADLTFLAVVSETMVRIFWRNQNPLGKSFRMNDVRVTVIGVVRDVKEYGVRSEVMPQAYFPFTLSLPETGFGHLTVRSRASSAGLLSEIRAQIKSLDSGLALFRPQTMDELIAEDTHDVSVQAFLLGTFAALALLLAAVGLYGVMSYLVSQRTREIGIRMALGASRSNVLGIIMKEGAKLTLIGVVLGMVAALALTRLLSSLLYGVNSADPVTFACVAALLAAVASAAYYIPARRAMKVDPMVALRYE